MVVKDVQKEAAAIVRDIILTPDETDPNSAIKTQLIQRTGESSQQEIRKLSTGEELGDRKPSELLRTMNWREASHNVPKELMLELFLQQLPTSVQTILASITPIAVEKAAEVADRILEEIERLNKRIDDLTLRHRTPQRRSNSRPRNRSRNRSFSRSRESDICWYHSKFQEKAKKFASLSEAEHIQHLRLLFERLDQYGLSIKPPKCTFGVPTLKFLGFQVCNTGIKLLEDRVEAILKFPQPTTITQLLRFLDRLNYYRRSIRQTAHILAPLVKFLKGIRNKKRSKRNVKIKLEEMLEWTVEAAASFELVKQSLAQATLLHHPMPNAPLSIWVDASDCYRYLDYKDIAAAQLVDDELKHLLESNSTSLTLKKQYFPLEDITLTCDVSTNVSRPFIPKDYRRNVFQHLHGLSHPGITASTKMVTQRFVWLNSRRDIKAWVKSCHPCQISKIHRHTKAPIGTFALPDARFSHLLIDFIGPFPPSNGQSYCLTIVDRFTRWMEVIPTADRTAETICRALLSFWISCFGCPAIITTDQGTNFESNLFRELSNLLGTNRILCCAYHPKANGLVERLHRHLKSAIKAHENSKWSKIIPIVLLDMRSAVKKDINATCAELVYGTTLRLPSDLFSTNKFTTTCNQTYVSFLREKMRSLQPIPTSAHTKSSMFVPTDLKSCSHGFFLGVDSVQPPLSQNYTGPHTSVLTKCLPSL
ncbi:hypothetical protein NPIL_180201 [Nephila pilipes]|uniref:RNA-directed DNA polymerase n=1 Tax=Nephila pilipes TaxID=299642 RepID=A0A8X6TN86_NEPPI|nr:hypothetical protein NPIL_180201 [Nephila pilipes]